MVEQQTPFTPEQQAELERRLNLAEIADKLTAKIVADRAAWDLAGAIGGDTPERFARTKDAQQDEAMRNVYQVPPAQPEPVAESGLKRRLVKTGEFKFAAVVAAIVAGLDLVQSPEFSDAFGNVAMTDGSLDVGKIGAIVIASVVFAVRQYAKAAGERRQA